MAASGEGSGVAGPAVEDTEKLLQRLNLEDDEADDLVWEDEIDA